jgi:hypothetical protein
LGALGAHPTMLFINNGEKKTQEDLDSIITTIGREFLSIKVE